MEHQNPIRAYREAQTPKMSQADLAAKLKVAKATISRWEKGKRFPDRRNWQRIRELTGIGPDELNAMLAILQ